MGSALRVAFAGTPEFAVPCLAACLATSGVEVVAVYTQPDRAAGRGRKLTASAVKNAAIAAGLVVEQPVSFKSVEARRDLAAYRPDLLVVVAYGLILSPRVLAIPRHGGWNVHASLLPRWRGAAPIQRAILAGDAETGVGLMQMESGLDTGPVLIERRTPIAADETGGRLHDRLATLGAEVLGMGLSRLVAGGLPDAISQAGVGVTYAHKLDKAEARLDWNEAAIALERKVRAFDPWPVAETVIAGERVRVWSARALPDAGRLPPGTVLAAGTAGIDIATADGRLRIQELQRDGGRRMAAADWLHARPDLAVAGRLGP